MFKIESYVTPILLSYVDKYVRDFKPADAQVSLWGGGVALHNLVLKADVLQQEVSLPFTLVSGRIHELLIQVPWTKIMSEPIVVTIDTIECVLSLHPPTPTSDDGPPPESPSPKTQVVEAPPGYMQALVRRIVSNIALRVHHLIVKYVQDDIVMSLNVKHLAVDSAGVNWEPAFADIDQSQPVIRRLVRLDDLTLCLDKADSDGKIRFYQEPLLYRCQLDFRVLTRLVSANTRRASNLGIQLRSSKLAWGVTSDQLTLLLRLTRERPAFYTKTPPPIRKATSTTVQATPLHVSSANSAEPARSESWSEWAWSWLPTWIDREGVEEAPMPPTPTPIHFTAYFDCVSLVFKVMELEGVGRKRGRGVLELSASYAAVKTSLCSPTTLRVRFGVRSLTLISTGKCVCGHLDISAANDQPTVYLRKTEKDDSEEGSWKWPEEDLNDVKVETAEVVDEEFKISPGYSAVQENVKSENFYPSQEERAVPEKNINSEDIDDLWHKMAPFIYMEYNHERSPSNAYINPYENPPKDFQYSDWVEECNLKINLAPVELMFCMGLLHRLVALKSIYLELPPVPEPDQAMHVLTVEECDALSDNLPQRRISIEAVGTRLRIIPWDHSLGDRPAQPPLVLDLELPKTTLLINGPLYPHRVCSAACQLPDDVGPLWQGARLHVSAAIKSIQAKICSPSDEQSKPCARADLRFVLHILLHKDYFTRRESVVFSYSLKIREGNMCGSAARLQAAYNVLVSLLSDRMSLLLRHTTLAKDALNDEEAAAVDFTFEDLSLRGYITDNINTHIMTLHSMRATAFHEPHGGELQQAWLFSGPDTPTTSPYLRLAVQWCKNPVPTSLDYVGLWTEPTAFCVDPLFIAWLAYRPQLKSIDSQMHMAASKSMSSTQYFMRRRATPPSSSGRGVSRSGSASGAELVHVPTRSIGSGSEPSEKKDSKQLPHLSKPSLAWWTDEHFSALHKRVRAMLINVEMGLILVYVTMSTASAIDCATVRDAMERHASSSQSVITFGLGQLTMNSSTATQHLWHEIRHDGPTTLTAKPEKNIDSFPWKLRLADVSCYTLEVRTITERYGQEKSSSGLRSQLKMPCVAIPRTVLEMVTTSVTVSVVTKSLQIKTLQKQDPKIHVQQNVKDEKFKYFKSGTDFKPSTLKEFVRGPTKRNTSTVTELPEVKSGHEPKLTIKAGPVVSLGVNLHVDTPPIIIRLDQDQIHMVAAALHCFKHILTLLRRSSLTLPNHAYSSTGASSRSLIRSVSEVDELHTPTEVSPSETRSELISIFDAHAANESKMKLKTFLWFQWVVSHAALVVATNQVKLAFDVDDIISTVDIQTQYNQLKIKLASASVRHYERSSSEDWKPGVLAGRVLEAREPTNAKEENNFMAITITQAQISTLPMSWKEELHPKVLEHKESMDNMWEVYATLAPLEAVLQPKVVDNIMSLVREMAPRSLCPLESDTSPSGSIRQWPFCYVTAGGLRLLLTTEEENSDSDDTFIFVIGKITVNPHPENPIFRHVVNVNTESSWLPASGGFEGRQYEVLVSNVAIRSAQFEQLVSQETSESEIMNGTGSENPALKWTQPTVMPIITPILHAVDIGCVLAPALYISGALMNGPAVELNILSDCAIEINFDQIGLMRGMISDLTGYIDYNVSGILFDEEKQGICPYATLLMETEREDEPCAVSDTTLMEELEFPSRRNFTADSGVDTVTSHSTYKVHRNIEEISIKKSLSVAFAEQAIDASEYLEVYLTMGIIELSLYTIDDNSPEVIALRPPKVAREPTPDPVKVSVAQVDMDELKAPVKAPQQQDHLSMAGSRSLTENVRDTDIGRTNLDFLNILPHARKGEGSMPLLHVTFNQPNLYYWKRRHQKTIQVSVFNAWLGLGPGQLAGHWHAVLLSTARGVPDPVTDIPPALATMKLVIPISSASTTHGSSTSIAGSRGTIRLDVERPVMIEVCSDRLRRLKGIYELVQTKLTEVNRRLDRPINKLPLLYKLRHILVHQQMESVTIQTSQIGVSGSEGTIGWDEASLQIAAGSRPDRLIVRGLVTSLLVAAGPPGDRRQVLMQPLMLGLESEATWELWRRAEGGPGAREPSIRLTFELDRVTIDLRPAELLSLFRILEKIEEIVGKSENLPTADNISDIFFGNRAGSKTTSIDRRVSSASTDMTDSSDHYYRDDLRSGAFKIVSGGQLPMAYQVMLFGSSVSWRYPHPRSITRVVAFPLPGQDTEIDCALEVYIPMLSRWEPHTIFKLPVSEPRELQLYVAPPEAVFAVMWRFRVCSPSDYKIPPFEFEIQKFMSRLDPLQALDAQPEFHSAVCAHGVTAEQLSGVLRVDSYFAPRLLPLTRLAVRVSSFEIHAHNALPAISSQATALEGYYVSRPLMRSHRVLCVSARNTTAYAQLGSPAGVMVLIDSNISSDILDCAMGTMEQLVDEFRTQAILSLPGAMTDNLKTRVVASSIHVALHVPRLRTLHALAVDWLNTVDQFKRESTNATNVSPNIKTKRELAVETAIALEGRVSLWIHNTCAAAFRIGQDGTDEVVPLGPGARLAYRWRSPNSDKKLRMAFAGPSTEWHWSKSIPFTAGSCRVRLEDAESLGSSKNIPGAGVYLYVKVEESGSRRYMHLSGRLALANMLRLNVLYKVRARCLESNQWKTVCSGELHPETVGESVVCGAECEMVLKIKFISQDTGWSGDIPLKECPKENVPWLVKVPSDGEVPYISVWCRVVRARSDGRILATVWPLYVLHSHLPLDTDVLIMTESGTSVPDTSNVNGPPPLIQTAPGRGSSTHLLAPGTTSARHSLSFQYRNIECPVTKEAVPLHYGVTDTSVFDKRLTVTHVDEVIADIMAWLERSHRNAISNWPYSIVAKHWDGVWQPALLQPRCDVTVRYRAVRAGGGCCLEMQLCPIVLLCNAASIALTLRAHDAAPLCKLEPGTAISPPSAVLKKPFFLSVEKGRETFVSGELAVSEVDPGRYGAPPPGRVALDHAANIAIQCNQKVALLTMYYEIKEEINVIGISSTYVLINRLNTDLLVSAMAVPIEVEHDSCLRPKTFKVVPPTKKDTINGTPLCHFFLRGRWRGSNPSELRVFLCLAMPAGDHPLQLPVPVRLGNAPVRRALALIDQNRQPVPVVVMQMKQENRWLVVVTHDPCPQFLVSNHTRIPLNIAQPMHHTDEPSTSSVAVMQECDRAKWWSAVYPDCMTHYSTPAHCERYPPPQSMASHSTIPFLTFAKVMDEGEPFWCPPVAVADGEQLLQICNGVTIKLRVRTYPHSTHLELQDVDQNDISASDIRRRLIGISEDSILSDTNESKKSYVILERLGGHDQLIQKSTHVESILRTNDSSVEDVSVSKLKMQSASFAEDKLSHAGIQPSKSEGSTFVIFNEELNSVYDADDDDERKQRAVDIDSMFAFSAPANNQLGEMDAMTWSTSERLRCVIASVVIEMASSTDSVPLLALHIDRAAILMIADTKKTKTIVSIADVQIDNLQYENGLYDFAVVATTRAEPLASEPWPPLWNMFAERAAFATRHENARLLLRLQHDKWTVVNYRYKELSEVDVSVGPLALYLEDAYVKALVELFRQAVPTAPASDAAHALADERSLQSPLRLRVLHVHPLDLTLTLHTAVRMYIALDQSPLRLSAFKLQDMMTSAERLTHALTVHYLSAAILGAGWVVGGLELLGAPGALAARVGGATGGVRGVASAAAAALLRSLSAWAGSLARNLDLLAGDEEHARRAAAARRRPPPSLVAGLVTGITNFAINILGAVGGLAHHPLVGVAVGETESGAAALRRGLLGALTKPLSATADLVAYAGHGLLTQTGWDPVPQPRKAWPNSETRKAGGWRRDCVRWTFRLADLTALTGFEVMLDNAPLQLLLTHKFLVVAEPETERIVEMIDLRFCTLGPHQGQIIELCVTQKRQPKSNDSRAVDEDDEYQISAAAMARVARYTGAEGAPSGEARVLALMPAPGLAHALHATLAAALHQIADTHFSLL